MMAPNIIHARKSLSLNLISPACFTATNFSCEEWQIGLLLRLSSRGLPPGPYKHPQFLGIWRQ